MKPDRYHRWQREAKKGQEASCQAYPPSPPPNPSLSRKAPTSLYTDSVPRRCSQQLPPFTHPLSALRPWQLLQSLPIDSSLPLCNLPVFSHYSSTAPVPMSPSVRLVQPHRAYRWRLLSPAEPHSVLKHKTCSLLRRDPVKEAGKKKQGTTRKRSGRQLPPSHAPFPVCLDTSIDTHQTMSTNSAFLMNLASLLSSSFYDYSSS